MICLGIVAMSEALWQYVATMQQHIASDGRVAQSSWVYTYDAPSHWNPYVPPLVMMTGLRV